MLESFPAEPVAPEPLERVFTSNSAAATELLEALGLQTKGVQSISFILEAGEAAVLRVKSCVYEDQAERIIAGIKAKRYKLVEIE